MIKHLVPFNTYSSPSFTARHFVLPISEPDCGSVRHIAEICPSASLAPYAFFCSSVPANRTGLIPKVDAAKDDAKPAST